MGCLAAGAEWHSAHPKAAIAARVFRPAVAMITGNDAVLHFPPRASLDRVDAQLDELIDEPKNGSPVMATDYKVCRFQDEPSLKPRPPETLNSCYVCQDLT